MRRRPNGSAGQPADGPRIEVLDRRSYETIQRLTSPALCRQRRPAQELHRSPRLAVAAAEPDRQRLAKGAEFLGNAERKLRMALLLAEGGFAAEAMPALDACLQLAANARRLMTGEDVVGEAVIAEPSAAAARPLDEIAGSIAHLLADIGRNLGVPSAMAWRLDDLAYCHGRHRPAQARP